MIQKSDVKVYLKAMMRGQDYLKLWVNACEQAGLDYVFALKGWGNNKPEGNPIETFDWDAPSILRSEIEQVMAASTTLHPACKGVGGAHCLPSWHNNRKYTINIDADDSIHDGNMSNLLLSALDMLEKSNTPILSYDVHMSMSDGKIANVITWPHVWCFGVCLSETEFMKNTLNTVLTKPWPYLCAWQGCVTIDMALDRYLQYNFDFPISFIAKTGKYIHRPPKPPCIHGPLYNIYDKERDFVIKDYKNWPELPAQFHYREITRHPRTKVIDV